MIFYKLHVLPGQYEGDEGDASEWFTSLRAAKKRRAELVAEDPLLKDHKNGVEDYEIERVELGPPSRKLVLAVLNRRSYVRRYETVVEAYQPGPCAACFERPAESSKTYCRECRVSAEAEKDHARG